MPESVNLPEGPYVEGDHWHCGHDEVYTIRLDGEPSPRWVHICEACMAVCFDRVE